MQLQIKDITRKYKNKTALNHVNIVLKPGVYTEIFSDIFRKLVDVIKILLEKSFYITW